MRWNYPNRLPAFRYLTDHAPRRGAIHEPRVKPGEEKCARQNPCSLKGSYKEFVAPLQGAG